MQHNPNRDPHDYRLVPQGKGWIVKSETTDWFVGTSGRPYWFDDQADAQKSADYANTHTEVKEIIAGAMSRMFRGRR